MAICEMLPVCIFVNERAQDIYPTGEYLKGRYCLRDPESCARFMVMQALGREKVPRDLLPYEHFRLKDIL